MSQIANFLTQVAVGFPDLFIKRLKPSDGVIDHLTYGVSDRGLGYPRSLSSTREGPLMNHKPPPCHRPRAACCPGGPIVPRNLRHGAASSCRRAITWAKISIIRSRSATIHCPMR
jgi:hypothetical protein